MRAWSSVIDNDTTISPWPPNAAASTTVAASTSTSLRASICDAVNDSEAIADGGVNNTDTVVPGVSRNAGTCPGSNRNTTTPSPTCTSSADATCDAVISDPAGRSTKATRPTTPATSSGRVTAIASSAATSTVTRSSAVTTSPRSTGPAKASTPVRSDDDWNNHNTARAETTRTSKTKAHTGQRAQNGKANH